MHDPMTVAWVVRRPWPERDRTPVPPGPRWRLRLHHDHLPSCGPLCEDNPFPWWRASSWSPFWTLAGRRYWWPPLVTVWHVEPGGRDSGTVCRQFTRWQAPDGEWVGRVVRGWRWHAWHWHVQVHAGQHLRRWALTRCAWCGGPSRKGDPVMFSPGGDRPRSPWWRGEAGLFHSDCLDVEQAHRLCLCSRPVVDSRLGYGDCEVCGRFRPWGREPDDADRILAALPAGSRIPAEARPALESAWAQRRRR